MYETLLRSVGCTASRARLWALPPARQVRAAVKEMWKAIDGFLAETEAARQPLARLFATPARAAVRPEGRRAAGHPRRGPALFDTEVALYEEGSFVPRPNAAIFERMFRSPEQYEMQRFRIAGPRVEVFQQIRRCS